MLTEIKSNDNQGKRDMKTASELEKKTSITMKFSKKLSSNGFKIPKIKRAVAPEETETPADESASGDPMKINRKRKASDEKRPAESNSKLSKKTEEGEQRENKNRKRLSSFLRIKFVNANNKKKSRGPRRADE